MLLYTLVYGAMPFDGSDFHRLKKQITSGSYYEPTHHSLASGLIRSMLTVNPAKRANITDIASHWWIDKDSLKLEDELSSSPNRRTSDYFEDDCVFADESKTQPERIVTPVFDSSKKPKKSILKKRNISSGDSGCALSDHRDNETSTVNVEPSSPTESAQTRLRATSETLQCEKGEEFKTRSKSLLTTTVQRVRVRRDSLSSSSSADILDFSYESPSDSSAEPTATSDSMVEAF